MGQSAFFGGSLENLRIPIPQATRMRDSMYVAHPVWSLNVLMVETHVPNIRPFTLSPCPWWPPPALGFLSLCQK